MINGILYSLEARNFLNKSHLETLQACDNYLLSKLFMSGANSPIIGYFWETGALPMKFVLMVRRLLYLWDILQKKNSELVRHIVDLQLSCPIKYDWITLVKNDLNQCDLEFNVNMIRSHSKSKFKVLIKSKIRDLAHEYLIKNRSSKTVNLEDFKFQDYITKIWLKFKKYTI